VKQMTHSLETYSVVAGSGWNDVPEPVTITTTVYTSRGTRRWFGDILTDTGPGSASPTPAAPAGAAMTSSPDEGQQSDRTLTSSASASGAKDIPLSVSPSPSATELYALLPIQHILSFSWPVQDFDFHATLDKVLQVVDAVWQLFRKVYHYPLDPT
jgi:hypothetical protein